jgi:hypothetical protein
MVMWTYGTSVWYFDDLPLPSRIRGYTRRYRAPPSDMNGQAATVANIFTMKEAVFAYRSIGISNEDYYARY